MSRIAEENIELFDDYLNNSPSAKDRKAFEARLSYDAEFNQEFEAYLNLEKSIKSHYRNQLKQKLNNADKKIDKKNKQRKTRNIIITATSIAACIAIIFYFIPTDSSNEKPAELVAKYWPYEEGLPVKMSSKGKYDDAMNAFKQENWKKAISYLEYIESDTAYYFQGVAHYELSDYSKAIKYLQKVPESSTYWDETQFRLALVMLITNEKEGMRMIREISNSKSSFSSEAQEVFEQL